MMKTEREKMLAGMPHNALEAGLAAELDRTEELLHDYNKYLHPSGRYGCARSDYPPPVR